MDSVATDTNTSLWHDAIECDGPACVTRFFIEHQPRLERTLQPRIDRHLRGRLDAADILQETYLEIQRRAAEYLRNPSMPLKLWVRFLTLQKLNGEYRRHICTAMRNARREQSISAPTGIDGTDTGEQMLFCLNPVDRPAALEELRLRLDFLLGQLDPLSREILLLRHFEERSNSDAARQLGIRTTTASNRYTRAISRLRTMLLTMPGYLEPDCF